MGKYLRKAKVTGEVAVVEVSAQSTLGVRTRARSLALQRLQGSSPASPSPDPASYLQLRSRRLEKAPPLASPRGGSCGPRAKPANSGSVPVDGRSRKCGRAAREEEADGGVEVSLGENVPEVDHWDRDVRETTPCSLIYVSENIATPGSTTRRSYVTSRRIQNAASLSVPNMHEMDEFFSGAEQLQQRIFSEKWVLNQLVEENWPADYYGPETKYNYDPVNDCPLPGRYEWVRLDY